MNVNLELNCYKLSDPIPDTGAFETRGAFDALDENSNQE